MGSGCLWDPPDFPDIGEVPVVANGQCAQSREAKVACVLDGDTLDLETCGLGERVRFLGIDAPAISHEGDPADCWGDESHQAVEHLLDGKDIILSFDADCEDIYGRTLAYIWLPQDDGESDVGSQEILDAMLVNEWILEQGLATIYDGDWTTKIRLEALLLEAESAARARCVGLWSACESCSQ